jgi:hypothetical protein
MLSVKISSRTHRRRARSSRATADGGAAVTILWVSDAKPAGMGRPDQIRRWAEPPRGGLGPNGGMLLFIPFQFLEKCI